MKRKNTVLIILFLIIVMVIGIFIAWQIKQHEIEKRVQDYTAMLNNTTFIGKDSNKTVNHGTAHFTYALHLNEDGTCQLTFLFDKYDDKSYYSTNKTYSFEIDVKNWSVGYENNDYYVCLSGGEWDWKDASAAKLSRKFKIMDIRDFYLKGLRGKYYDVYFNKEE